MLRVEQQRMRKALIDAEMELQQDAVSAQDKRRSLQVVSQPQMLIVGMTTRSISYAACMLWGISHQVLSSCSQHHVSDASFK